MHIDGYVALLTQYCQHTPNVQFVFQDERCIMTLGSGQSVIALWDEDVEEVIFLAPAPLLGNHNLSGEEALIVLKSAYLGLGLAGSAVGLDEANNTLVAWRRIPAEGLSLASIHQNVERVAAAAQALVHP